MFLFLSAALALLTACGPQTASDHGGHELFNGENLEGWEMVGAGRFVVEDGLMKTVGGMGLLYYAPDKFGNCSIEVEFKTTRENDNSGVVIRMPEPPPDPWYGVHNGYEVQIQGAGDDWHATGSFYSLAKVDARPQRPAGEWNVLRIELDGPITRSYVNDVQVMEFDPSKPVPPREEWYEPVRGPRPDTGYIGLQNHDAESTVYFKRVTVIPTPD